MGTRYIDSSATRTTKLIGGAGCPRRRCGLLWLAALALWLGAGPGNAQLFTNLSGFVIQYPVGDPKASAVNSLEGPKGIATADLDGDGNPDLAASNSDGTVTVWFGRGNGRFEEVRHLRTGGADLRGIACADFNGDTRPDIATVSPYDGNIYLFLNQGNRRFDSVVNLAAWLGARNLAAGDFDGDGWQDLAVAGTTNGVRQYRGLGDGGFVVVTNLTALAAFTEARKFPKPVFTLKTLRSSAGARDELVATHAHTNRVWVLGTDANGRLEVKSSVVIDTEAQSFDTGNMTSTNLYNTDLITVDVDEGTVSIHPGAFNRFEARVHQTLYIPGGPRAVRVADLDGDGWNDLIVVVRNLDTVLTYRNSNGFLEPASERPVGLSPRELVVADLNHDGYPDAVVMNHHSQDVTVLTTFPRRVGFMAADHMYLVNGNVVGLVIKDFNGDGRDDVIQLHRAAGDFSVRLAGPEGLLGAPAFYTIGNLPASQVISDVNNDRIPDQVTANLGLTGIEQSAVSVRLGQGDGTFGEEKRYYLPAEKEGRIYALVPGDFDRDGNIDLAAGYLDGRLAFFQGRGDGTFEFTREHPLCDFAQEIAAGDFDRDGDLDLAVVDTTGKLFIMENRGDPLWSTALAVESYPTPAGDDFGVRTLKTVDLNHDGDLDLVIGSSQRALLYRGGPGTGFSLQATNLGGIDFSVSGVVEADFDHDGRPDLVMGNHARNRITVLTQPAGDATGTNWTTALVADVPACKFLATGDLDGDGLPDLAGTGNILWTALSGRNPQMVGPLQLEDRGSATNATPLINELLAANTLLPVAVDGERTSAWAEVFNGTGRSLSLADWRLRLVSGESTNTLTNEFTFPPTAYLANGAHLIVIFSQNRRTLYHTGFELPQSSATLTLISPTGLEADRVAYPAQVENVSYARYHDGLPSFVFNPYPSPGRSNADNGRLPPEFELESIDPATFQAGKNIRFLGVTKNGADVIAASLIYQRLDVPAQASQRVTLYDDGQHADGAADDERFAGELTGGLPAGAQFQYLLQIEDLDKETYTIPEDPLFARPGQPGNLDTLAIPAEAGALPLEISEVVPYNVASLFDEIGGTPDWLELRNYSGAAVALNGVSLARQLSSAARFSFPSNQVLAPGEHLVLYCDANPGQGSLHAPFNLNRLGDQVVLCVQTTNGARTLVDWVQFGAMKPDQAWARLGRSGGWRFLPPTPKLPNVTNYWLGPQTNGAGWTIAFAFPTATNQSYSVEYRPTLTEPGWSVLPRVEGDGLEAVVTRPWSSSGFFRVRAHEE